jgi:non-heme chloroperoxidase
METPDLRDLFLIGFLTGGEEIARYIGRHGTKRWPKSRLSTPSRR